MNEWYTRKKKMTKLYFVVVAKENIEREAWHEADILKICYSTILSRHAVGRSSSIFGELFVKNRKFPVSFDFKWNNGILLPKLLVATVRKDCSSDREKLLRSLEQFIQTVKGQNNFW